MLTKKWTCCLPGKQRARSQPSSPFRPRADFDCGALAWACARVSCAASGLLRFVWLCMDVHWVLRWYTGYTALGCVAFLFRKLPCGKACKQNMAKVHDGICSVRTKRRVKTWKLLAVKEHRCIQGGFVWEWADGALKVPALGIWPLVVDRHFQSSGVPKGAQGPDPGSRYEGKASARSLAGRQPVVAVLEFPGASLPKSAQIPTDKYPRIVRRICLWRRLWQS